MSRLDQKNPGTEKTEVRMTPSPEEILGQAYSVASYNERVREKKAQLDSVKGRGKPLGGAPPLDPTKMRTLADLAASKPLRSFFDQPNPEPLETKAEKSEAPLSMMQEGKQTDRKLSPETVKALTLVEESKKEESKSPIEFGDPTEEEMDKVAEEASSPSPEFDFASISNHRELLLSKKRREAIEKNLSPLDLADMVVKREIQQHVTVVEGKLSYTFRTFNQHEHLFCLRYIYEFPGSALYVNELLNTCKLVCSLVAVNNALLPEHRKDIGTSKEQVDRELFVKKMFHVASFPTQMIADISVQAVWFDERVGKLFSLENLKNG